MFSSFCCTTLLFETQNIFPPLVKGYLFGDTHHAGDGKSKFEQIVHILKQVNKKHPGFKIYVTGHSLGA
jgi:putative lipase involved disintegration of autophagic bodies